MNGLIWRCPNSSFIAVVFTIVVLFPVTAYAGTSVPSGNAFVVPSSDAENGPLTIQLNREKKLNDVVQELMASGRAKLEDHFGGISIQGATIVIHITQPFSDDEERVFAAVPLPEGIDLKFVSASRTSKDLEGTVIDITRRLNEFESRQVDVVSVGVADVANLVRVVVPFGRGASAESLLGAEYGDRVRVEEEFPLTLDSSRVDSPGLYKTGLEMHIEHSGWYEKCTTGFAVRAWDGAPAAITAGHCGGQSDIVTHGGPRIGVITISQFSGDIDGAGMVLDLGQTSNWLFRENNWMEPIQSFSTAPVGAAVCSEGATLSHRCGSVVTRNTTVNFGGGNTLTNQDCASFGSAGGDSGGPIYQFGTGVGITSSANSTTTCYTPVQRIASWLGATPITGPLPKTITVDLNSLCLDADAGSGTANGTEVQQWWCLTPSVSTKNQAWYVEPTYLGGGRWSENYTLKASHNFRCVDYDLNNLGNGGYVQQWDCLGPGQSNQQFHFMRGVGLSNGLQNVQNGRCIDMDANGGRYGNRAQQWDCNLQRHQRFTLLERPIY